MSYEEILNDKEYIVMEGMCNRVKHPLFVQNGHAVLTNCRFIYLKCKFTKIITESLADFVKGNYDFDILLNDIVSIEDGRQGVSRTIIIHTIDGKRYNFYLLNREEWREALQNGIRYYHSKAPNTSITIKYGDYSSPSLKEQILEQTNGEIDYKEEYVRISTSGDERVCPMCAQFEGKIFLASDAPKLPLCPSCACAYEHYLTKKDLPANCIISSAKDFVFPAACTLSFYKHAHQVIDETDIHKQIRMCESDLKKLSEFMAPYLSAGFPPPDELICRDLLPELYMQLGQWDKAERVIKTCITEKAYELNDGLSALTNFVSYRKIAIEALAYIQEHPGCLQRNIYKALSFEGDDREQLKEFLRYSKQIKKVKHGNTNELYCI